MFQRLKTYFACFFFILILVLLVAILIPSWLNCTRKTSYDTLNDIDRAVLRELNSYWKSEILSSTWDGFSLTDKAILAINKNSHYAFLINPKKPLHNLFAKEISLPSDFPFRVWRLSITDPSLLQFHLSGDFNIIGKKYSLHDNDVYYTKYNTDSIRTPQSSKHYITFLTHEAFHYYMQSNWPGGHRFDTSALSSKDLELMGQEYIVLGEIYHELKKTEPNHSLLLELTRDYTSIMKSRINANPDYMNDEMLTETAEGTATYIGLYASKIVGYDFRIMHVDASSVGKGIVELSFDSIIPMIQEGLMNSDVIASDIVYQSGALLCELLDALQVSNWKQQLNAQSEQSPVTLYSLLRDFILSNQV